MQENHLDASVILLPFTISELPVTF